MTQLINITYGTENILYPHEILYLCRMKGRGERYIISTGNSIEGKVAK